MLVSLDSATELLVWGALLHLAVDWLGQNVWIADHKASLRHPAGWLHAGMHALAFAIIFPLGAAIALGALHLAIDSRRPLAWLRRFVSQPEEGPIAISVHIWRDQTLHLMSIGVVALVVAG